MPHHTIRLLTDSAQPLSTSLLNSKIHLSGTSRMAFSQPDTRLKRIVICHIIVHELHDHGLSLPAALRAAPVEAARAAAGAIAAVRLQVGLVGRARSTLGGCRRLWHRQPGRAMPVVAAHREPEPKLGRGTRWRSPSVGSGVAACGRSARC